MIQWKPLSSGMCDTLVENEEGQRCWHSSRSLQPTDDLGPLPSRSEALEEARKERLRQLRTIREDLVQNFHERWFGLEHGKALVGRALDNAIKETE